MLETHASAPTPHHWGEQKNRSKDFNALWDELWWREYENMKIGLKTVVRFPRAFSDKITKFDAIEKWLQNLPTPQFWSLHGSIWKLANI